MYLLNCFIVLFERTLKATYSKLLYSFSCFFGEIFQFVYKMRASYVTHERIMHIHEEDLVSSKTSILLDHPEMRILCRYTTSVTCILLHDSHFDILLYYTLVITFTCKLIYGSLPVEIVLRMGSSFSLVMHEQADVLVD